MSALTGKCDLYDHVYMIGSKGTTDEMSMKEKFDIFHKRTGGKLYQNIKIELTQHNVEFYLDKEKHKFKECELEEGKKGYECNNQKYKSLAEINKKGFYTTRTIYFDDMLELFPYLGYIISSMASDTDKETVYISQYDYNVERELNAMKSGNKDNAKRDMTNYKELLLKTIEEMK